MLTVRRFQDQFPRYMQYVKNGENVVITEHNEPIAELSALKKADASFDQKLMQLNKEGKVVLAQKKSKTLIAPKIEEKWDYISILNEVRSDRV